MFALSAIGKMRGPLLGVLLILYVPHPGSFADAPAIGTIESSSYTADVLFAFVGSPDIPACKFRHDGSANISSVPPPCFFRAIHPPRDKSSRCSALHCVCTVTSRAPPETR